MAAQMARPARVTGKYFDGIILLSTPVLKNEQQQCWNFRKGVDLMKYCPYCGASLVGSAASFCSECGKKIPTQAESPQSKPRSKGNVNAGNRPAGRQKHGKSNAMPPRPSKRRTNPMDFNYDGYYDDVKPIDAGMQDEHADPELMRKSPFCWWAYLL